VKSCDDFLPSVDLQSLCSFATLPLPPQWLH
jgi:hypothetical protein